MAYATVELQTKLAEHGFYVTRIMGEDVFYRLRDGRHQQITAAWERSGLRSLDVPAPELVFWIATSVGEAGHVGDSTELVVPASERCPDPITCFVSAEVRGWKRQT